jgi:hypothetical protein
LARDDGICVRDHHRDCGLSRFHTTRLVCMLTASFFLSKQ